MSEPSSFDSFRATRHGTPMATHPRHAAQAANVQDHPGRADDDPVTEWLLEQRHIDDREFAVLFAIHKHNAWRSRSAWIRRIELCRSSGLSQVSLTRVLNELRQRGLVGLSRHPVDSCRARYMLMIA